MGYLQRSETTWQINARQMPKLGDRHTWNWLSHYVNNPSTASKTKQEQQKKKHRKDDNYYMKNISLNKLPSHHETANK